MEFEDIIRKTVCPCQSVKNCYTKARLFKNFSSNFQRGFSLGDYTLLVNKSPPTRLK